MTIFDSIIDNAQNYCELLAFKELYIEYKNTDKEECGHCENWMKSSLCPAEINIKGRRTGPSCSGIICKKYKLTDWVKELKQERLLKLKQHKFYYLVEGKGNMRELTDLLKGA